MKNFDPTVFVFMGLPFSKGTKILLLLLIGSNNFWPKILVPLLIRPNSARPTLVLIHGCVDVKS